MNLSVTKGAILLSCTLGHMAHVVAQDTDIEEQIVFGRLQEQIGSANASSEGAVGGADLAVRPLLKVAELLEAVPGMVAAQHSGSGKANQYFMRGFNLDHGTDFTNYIDDVPMNMRSHGHGQGYLDVNGLIPETVSKIDYRKGTYRADMGDFSMAGVSLMSTIDRLDSPFVSLESGSDDWQRLAGGATFELGDGALTLIAESKSYDGPWERPEDLDHKAIWAKYIQETSLGTLSTSLSGYSATWAPTEQIPESAIGTVVCEDEFCALDTTSQGETDRWIATLNLVGDEWRGTLYAQTYDWEMASDPTYAEQINQFDKRNIFGGRLEKSYLLSDQISTTFGSEFRYDDADRVGVDFFEDGEFLAENGDNAITEASAGLYAEAVYQPTESLRILAGLRGDYYDFDVTALNALSEEGTASDSILSPKLGLAYRFNDAYEGYLNWGRGFHSNDARGVVNDTDPVPGLVDGEGSEIGIRFEQGELKLSATYWQLDLDSELVFVGDSNSVEPKGGSERDGIEFTAAWNPIEWLAIDAVYTVSDAKYTDPIAAGGEHIEGAVEDSGQLGLTAHLENWELSSRLRYLGEYALTPDNLERADSTVSLNMRAAYLFDQFTIYGELINATDEDGKDIVYFYETDVEGLGVSEGRVSRASVPRTVRLGVKYEF